MNFFEKKKKKESCCCQGDCNANAAAKAETSKVEGAFVKILGGGCAKCNQLEANTLEALKQLGMDTSIDHITDFAQIAEYGVMTTPALVYNDKVISYGKVLKTEEIVALIQKEI